MYTKVRNTMPPKKELCYDLQCDVIAIVTLLQLIVEPERELSPAETEKRLKQAFKVAGHATKIVQHLYLAICSEGRNGIPLSMN
jgi:hypothetical protein